MFKDICKWDLLPLTSGEWTQTFSFPHVIMVYLKVVLLITAEKRYGVLKIYKPIVT